MNFFEHQQEARRRTKLLIFLYILGVICLIGVPVVIASIAYFSSEGQEVDPAQFLLVVSGIAGFVLLIVLGGSLYKSTALSQGGGKLVAESLGGRLVSPNTGNLAERRLYNVVEEMSLAAGIPVPAIYIMDNEHSINAFAAGFSPNEAVIGCNRGTVELLTRDELQGVIAHEFSHILNGDMRMNLRLIGILFGLQVLSLIGYYVMRIGIYMPQNRRSNDKGAGGIGLAMLGGGLAVMILGYIGVFFSAIIQAAISRQREFLADASAVQFTRNPAGIAGALKKIGCPNVGSSMESPAAAEASHLFFGNACSLFSFGSLLATHPPLPIRIKRIDPAFDGKFPATIHPLNAGFEENSSRTPKGGGIPPIRSGSVGDFPQLSPESVAVAAATISRIPQGLSEPVNNYTGAVAAFFAMLLDKDPAIRKAQLAVIEELFPPALLNETLQQEPQIRALADELKIPLVQRVMSSMRAMPKEQYIKFGNAVDNLIAADNKMDLFEYTIKALLLRDLDIYFGLAKHLSVRYSNLTAVQGQTALVLSYLAYSGHQTLQEVQSAYNAAAGSLALDIPLLPIDEISTVRFDKALRVLAETSPELKQKIFDSFLGCIKADGKIIPKELELIRAVAAMLTIPMPQFND
ncbi:Zn-dependent protease [Planctomycetales bacterium]|nr:Zn-dependent protease [Planctomycetales bacterium]